MGTWPGYQMYQGYTIEIRRSITMGFEKYNRRKVKASSMTGFIHISKDLSTSHGGENAARSSELPSSGTIIFTGNHLLWANRPSTEGY